MRDLTQLDKYRVALPSVYDDLGLPPMGDAKNGAFLIPLSTDNGRLKGSKDGEILRVIAASAGGWDHVSVSLEHRAPSWEEMSFAYHLFFSEDEVAWQYHIPSRDHINIHPNCLHIWRRKGFRMPLPPRELV